MITIEGLTPRQFQIMELLWGCSSIDQVEVLINAMPTDKDRCDAKSLVLIATHETIEQELGFSKEVIDAATRAIDHARC